MLSGDPRFHVALIGLLVGMQVFFTVLAIRNVRYSASTIDAERDWMRQELEIDDPSEVVDYTRTKAGFSHLQSWVGLGVLLILLYAGVFTGAVTVVESIGLGPIAGGTIFFVGVAIALQVYSIPFDLVDTFVIEELFEFNNQTPRLWVRDTLLGLVISVVLTAAVIAALLAFIEWLPMWWWLAGTGFFVFVAIVMQVLYPRVIAPLFNEFEPIETGELRRAVESVFDRAGFACEELYTMDASRRSSHVNAYFVGFGRTKRVVLFDTLIERMQIPEIQSVLAHELAHWQRKHVWKRLGVGAVRIGVVLFVLWWLLGQTWVYEMFALPQEATYAGLVVGLLFVGPLMELTAPIENRLSLAHEREADDFAVSVMGDGEPLASALSGLAAENLANPFPHPLYAAFHYTHPPIPERIRRLRDRGASQIVSTGSE